VTLCLSLGFLVHPSLALMFEIREEVASPALLVKASEGPTWAANSELPLLP
jgi:hypothetical protein